MAILDQFGKPIQSGHYVPTPSRESGSFRGSIANWHPRRVSNSRNEADERRVTQRRANELYANDWSAKSGIRAIADNAIGTGLKPDSQIPYAQLGISKEDAHAIGEKMEWIFSIWSQSAHARGMLHFEDLQYLGILSILKVGEMLHLPVMLPLNEKRQLSLVIQDLRPERLCTPADLTLNLNIRDGVELNSWGEPVAYWIATPRPSLATTDTQFLYSSEFTRKPAMFGHRKNVFHLFRQEYEEQVRGVSQLSCGIKLFRHLNDALESELFAQVIAASFPVFIGLENGSSQLPPEVREQMGLAPEAPMEREMDVSPGTVIFGNPNEKPYILENKRPGSNFPPFVEIVQRSVASLLGIPYETLTKDFSKTNYSSMRAALNEAWKHYSFYRSWFSRLYAQPVWEMVIEEAYLRNFLGLADDLASCNPAHSFYEGFPYWTNASWTGPAKGFIDPVKEIQATILALQARLMTYADAWAEHGRDFSDALPVMEEEQKMLQSLSPTLKTKLSTPQPENEEDEKDTGDNDEQE